MSEMNLLETESGTTVELAVSGMTCGSCSASVEKALTALPAVRSASVDHASGRAVVLLAPEASADDFGFEADAAVHDAGYTLESATLAATAPAPKAEGCCGGGCCS